MLSTDAPRRLPEAPGCYLFRDAAGAVLYVGKARSLRARVRTYFQDPARLSQKIRTMVDEAAKVDYVLTHSEWEALVLENNLIKEHQPLFNTLLRDDKTYPYVVLTVKDRWPKGVFARRPPRDGSLVFGPFVPGSQARRHLRIIQRMFKVPTCKVTLDGKRGRPCLYYHLNQCHAPCVEGLADEQAYARSVQQVRLYLEGRTAELEKRLSEQMEAASAALNFEEAADLRDLLKAVRELAKPQQVEAPGLARDADIAALHAVGGCATVELFHVRGGRMLARHCAHVRDRDLEPGAALEAALSRYYAESADTPRVLVCDPPLPGDSMLPDLLNQRAGRTVQIQSRPQGALRAFLELCRTNAREHFDAHFVRKAGPHPALEALARALGLDEPPSRIEGFDISHHQGAETVASCVVFDNAAPLKREYRSFNVRGLDGPDDFASIGQAVTRRYQRQLEEGKELPDLVLIDGGAGQLSAARAALSALGLDALGVVSLAKREELIHRAGGPPLFLDRRDEGLRLLQRVRDESHRFAVSHHRRRMQGRTTRSRLEDLPGIGPGLAKKLLRELGSASRVRAASEEQLAAVLGPRRAKALHAALHP